MSELRRSFEHKNTLSSEFQESSKTSEEGKQGPEREAIA